jgi:hypothetical protein
MLQSIPEEGEIDYNTIEREIRLVTERPDYDD